MVIRCSSRLHFNKVGDQIFPGGETDPMFFKLEIQSEQAPTEQDLTQAKLMKSRNTFTQVEPTLADPNVFFLPGWQLVYDLYRTKGKNRDDARSLVLTKLTQTFNQSVTDRKGDLPMSDHEFYMTAFKASANQARLLSQTLSRTPQG